MIPCSSPPYSSFFDKSSRWKTAGRIGYMCVRMTARLPDSYLYASLLFVLIVLNVGLPGNRTHSFCLINDDADIAYEDNFKSANIVVLKLPLKLLRELADLNNVYWSIQSASPGSFKVLYMDSYAVSSFLSGVGSSLHDSNLSISPFRYSHDMLWNTVVHARQSKASELNFSLDNQLAALRA
ncbi:uncharacterized protein ARMOST_14317 [Armillaria ostoyae]|uniref:Uncharacterized protein n=1 Tax=Armillaria ostoyae TaxID=47428 RepID=A0A284RQ95_ARMOS|nr:uncharacterized protein ARMOST_14317 [Armillaria ostoyae]